MKKQVYEQIVEYCKEEAPIEACGLISGVGNKIKVRINII